MKCQITLILLTYLSCVFAACSDQNSDEATDETDGDTVTTSEDAPSSPPAGTINVDLGVAGSSEETIPDDDGTESLTYLMGESSRFLTINLLGTEYVEALLKVVQVNLLVKSNLVIPIQMLNKAAEESPSYKGNRSWVWSFDITSSKGIVYTSNLTGTSDGDGSVDWTMVVNTDSSDSNGCCEDFTYFDGTVDSMGSGSWTIYDPSDENNEDRLFSIDYEYSSDSSRMLEFELHEERTSSAAFGAGSKITFTTTSTTNTILIDDISEDLEETIEWDTTSLAGSYTNTSGTQKCWASKSESYASADCED